MAFERVAVTGSNGQLGGAICRLLGRRAIALDRNALPLDRPAEAGAEIERLRPDAVVNCGAYVAVDKAEQEEAECFRCNAEAPEAIAAACDRLDAPFVQISTDYVFCRSEGRTPRSEADPIAPDGVYARSKAAGERAAAGAKRGLVVRTCGLYGHSPRRANFVETMLRLGGEGRDLRIVSDQFCTPSYAENVARAIVFLLDSETRGFVHVTDAGETSWYEFAGEIFRLAEMEVSIEPISSEAYGAPAPRPAYSVLDGSRYRDLGGPEMPHWRTALATYLKERTG